MINLVVIFCEAITRILIVTWRRSITADLSGSVFVADLI